MAEPGGICLSERIHEDAAGKVDAVFEDIGEQQLKNIARPVRVHRVRRDHPLRVIREIANASLQALSEDFAALYSPFGRESIPPERLVRALAAYVDAFMAAIRWENVAALCKSYGGAA